MSGHRNRRESPDARSGPDLPDPTECLHEISLRLTTAARITNAAIACADAGAEEEAVQIVMDLEQHTYEADKLLGAVTLLSRLRRARMTS